jgi:acyl carrier protein
MTKKPEATNSAVLDAIRMAAHDVKGSFIAAEDITESTGLWSSESSGAPSLYLDSLDLLELVVFIENEYGWAIEDDQIDPAGWQTVGDLATVLTRAGRQNGSADGDNGREG